MADPSTSIPKLRVRLDAERLRSLPLAPVDGFVLSRIDGALTVLDLAHVSGLTFDQVLASVTKLHSLDIIEVPGLARSPSPVPPPPPPPRRAPPRSAPPVARSSPPPRTRSTPPPPPPQIEEGIDLEPAHQIQILDLWKRASEADHYALLGVERTVDKKAIKRAYFELAAKVHPDKFFRKKLGGFKLRMETIFGKITEAHETLTSKEHRAEYDAYLATVEKTKALEAMVVEAMREMERAEEAARRSIPVSSMPPRIESSPPPKPSVPRLEVQMRIAPPRSSAPPRPASPVPGEAPRHDAVPRDLRRPVPLTPLPPPPVGAGGGPAPIPAPRHGIPPARTDAADAQSRRELLARRLTGNAGPRVASPPKPPPKLAPINPPTPAEAVDALKRRYEDKISAARASQAQKYADIGAAERAKNDMVAAANAYRVAVSFAPDDAELKGAFEETARAADVILSEGYLRQAHYEERSEHWAEAAKSWARVARTRPDDATAHERAAHCLVKADGNLHEAAALAQRASILEPRTAKMRLTLANVYLAAGLTLNARRELEAAAQIAPDDDTIQQLLRRIAKAT